MSRDEVAELRSKAQGYRERADRGLNDLGVTEAFYEIARTLERRAAVSEAAVLDSALEGVNPSAAELKRYGRSYSTR
jgi:hypothetical protein